MFTLILITTTISTKTEVEGAFNLLIVTVLSAPQTAISSAVQSLVDTLTKTESNKTSLKQKM
jgi:translation initiation factor 3 subunit M